MKKFLPLILLAIAILVGVGVFLMKKSDGNNEDPDLMEAPPVVSKINALALAKRPYVELIPHKNPARCNGVDMNITNLKNGEEKVEYELEYTTEKMIQGVFGRREFSNQEEHAPLEFGTCSRGTCRCDDDITGGSLKLSFTGEEEYVLKGDFSVHKVGNSSVATSRDARLKLEVGSALSQEMDVLITSTFGLPAELAQKVLLGPYGVFVQGSPDLKEPIKATLQSSDVVNGQVQFWDGEKWNILETEIIEDRAEFELDQLGVIVLTEK
ncbi:MAG: hypothetical protein ACOX6V_05780 [Patescibacteria group bacterium]